MPAARRPVSESPLHCPGKPAPVAAAGPGLAGGPQVPAPGPGKSRRRAWAPVVTDTRVMSLVTVSGGPSESQSESPASLTAVTAGYSPPTSTATEYARSDPGPRRERSSTELPRHVAYYHRMCHSLA